MLGGELGNFEDPLTLASDPGKSREWSLVHSGVSTMALTHKEIPKLAPGLGRNDNARVQVQNRVGEASR